MLFLALKLCLWPERLFFSLIRCTSRHLPSRDRSDITQQAHAATFLIYNHKVANSDRYFQTFYWRGKSSLLVRNLTLKFLKEVLSKPNVTQLNSTQLKATQKQLRWVRHSSHPRHPTPNFSGTSRRARELKFCTTTH